MTRILHMSDLHFGPPYVPRVGDAAVAAAGALSPDVLVVSGDFTQRARKRQYAEARAYLDRLPDVPTVVTPGNHDVALYRWHERMLWPFRNYRRYISRALDSVLHVDGLCIVSLNSTAPHRAITNGRIHRSQLEFARRAFADAAPDAARIVVSHHHFAPAPDYEGGEVMPKAKRAIDAFIEWDVEMILGGHLHRAYIGNSLDVYPGRHRERGIIIAQSGTTTSRRGRARETEKNTFNLIEVSEETFIITHYMYFDDEPTGDAEAGPGGFAPTSRHIFPRQGRHVIGPHPVLTGAVGERGAAATPPQA